MYTHITEVHVLLEHAYGHCNFNMLQVHVFDLSVNKYEPLAIQSGMYVYVAI